MTLLMLFLASDLVSLPGFPLFHGLLRKLVIPDRLLDRVNISCWSPLEGVIGHDAGLAGDGKGPTFPVITVLHDSGCVRSRGRGLWDDILSVFAHSKPYTNNRRLIK